MGKYAFGEYVRRKNHVSYRSSNFSRHFFDNIHKLFSSQTFIIMTISKWTFKNRFIISSRIKIIAFLYILGFFCAYKTVSRNIGVDSNKRSRISAHDQDMFSYLPGFGRVQPLSNRMRYLRHVKIRSTVTRASCNRMYNSSSWYRNIVCLHLQDVFYIRNVVGSSDLKGLLP